MSTNALAKVAESRLPDTHHLAYRMRLAGKRVGGVGGIAAHFHKRRETIWRWCQLVEAEYRKLVEHEPVLNQISREVAGLTDLEMQARENLEASTNDRAIIGFLGEARKAATARQNFLLTVGVLPKEPERLYTATVEFKPMDDGTDDDNTPLRSRQEMIETLIDALSKGRTL